jgi:TorA maturation chaperone TorD
MYKKDSIINLLEGKRRFYGYMSKLFFFQPDEDQLNIFVKMAPFLLEILADNKNLSDRISYTAKEIESLDTRGMQEYILKCQTKYSLLFYVKCLPVTESNYLSPGGQNNSELVDCLLAEYSRTNYRAELKHSNEPADHVGFQLGFLEDINARIFICVKNNDTEQALKGFKAAEEFISEHLIRWIDDICDKILDMDNLEHYFSQMAEALRYFLKEDLKSLKSGYYSISGV